MFDLVEVGGGHQDALQGVLGSEDDVLLALAVLVEDDVGDLLILAVNLVAVVVDGVDFDGLAEGVVIAGLFEFGLALAELGDDLVDGEVFGRGGIERAKAALGAGGERRCESEGEQSGGLSGEQLHGLDAPVRLASAVYGVRRGIGCSCLPNPHRILAANGFE